jgi:hypothetical protein
LALVSTPFRRLQAASHDEGGWALLMQGRKLHTRPKERIALEQSGLVVFILANGWAPVPYWEKAAGIVRWLPAMLGAFGIVRPPFLLSVPHRRAPAPLRPFRQRRSR